MNRENLINKWQKELIDRRNTRWYRWFYLTKLSRKMIIRDIELIDEFIQDIKQLE